MIIWRGFGWAVPVIVIAAYVLTQLGVDGMYGEDYYKVAAWPQYVALAIAAMLIAVLGIVLNHKKRVVYVDEQTGEHKKSPSHTLFFIPIEFWAVLVPVVFLYVDYSTAEQEAKEVTYLEAPLVNDRYLVDFSEIFEEVDPTYIYGVMKVSSVEGDTLYVQISQMSYDMKKGPREDVSKGKTLSADYYFSDTVPFSKSELLELHGKGVIYSIAR